MRGRTHPNQKVIANLNQNTLQHLGGKVIAAVKVRSAGSDSPSRDASSLVPFGRREGKGALSRKAWWGAERRASVPWYVLSGEQVPDSATAEGSSIVEEPRVLDREVSEENADLWPLSVSFRREPSMSRKRARFHH